MATTFRVTGLEVRCDSLLAVIQVKGEYTAKDEQMTTYLQLTVNLKLKFHRCDFKQISRSKNNHADFLANLGSAVELPAPERDSYRTHREAQHSVILGRGAPPRHLSGVERPYHRLSKGWSPAR